MPLPTSVTLRNNHLKDIHDDYMEQVRESFGGDKICIAATKQPILQVH